MSFSIGIVGLPNVGKSTLFEALTQREVDISQRPFTTIKPNLGVVSVPDSRLEKIAQIENPEQTIPTTIKFLDIAGLVEKAHQGQGLGNQFLSHIRPCKAIIEVVRIFEDPKIEHVPGPVNPAQDIDTVNLELLMKDLQTTENLLEKMKNKKDPQFKTLNQIHQSLLEEKPIRDLDLSSKQKQVIKPFQFLTEKPLLYLFNENSEHSPSPELINQFSPNLSLDLKLELEATQLDPQERKELELNSALDQVILNCYNILNLITFFTRTGGKELRAWTVPQDTACPKAGGKVHSDFEQKFIKAKVIPWKVLVENGGWNKAQERGLVKTVGRDYKVKDGEVIEFII